jgi:dihydroorotate dehydrogenase
VGGISRVEDAWEKVLAGASLLQVYSALVYEGPSLPSVLVAGLRERLAGARWEQVVGQGR